MSWILIGLSGILNSAERCQSKRIVPTFGFTGLAFHQICQKCNIVTQLLCLTEWQNTLLLCSIKKVGKQALSKRIRKGQQHSSVHPKTKCIFLTGRHRTYKHFVVLLCWITHSLLRHLTLAKLKGKVNIYSTFYNYAHELSKRLPWMNNWFSCLTQAIKCDRKLQCAWVPNPTQRNTDWRDTVVTGTSLEIHIFYFCWEKKSLYKAMIFLKNLRNPPHPNIYAGY